MQRLCVLAGRVSAATETGMMMTAAMLVGISTKSTGAFEKNLYRRAFCLLL
jgi:hypothetical protein